MTASTVSGSVKVAADNELLNAIDQIYFRECERACRKVHASMENWLILVNVGTQKMHLFKQRKYVYSYPVSTAAKGVGQESGSYKTPLGLHHVKEKIGARAEPFAVFESRVKTGRLAAPMDEKGCIVGRILWLQGLEPGFNTGNDSKGKMVDTYKRYVYIHGTNQVQDIGTPMSAGCVNMLPKDVIDLFDKVPEGTPVYIYL